MNTAQNQHVQTIPHWNPGAWYSRYEGACRASDKGEIASLNRTVAESTTKFLETGYVMQETWPPNGAGAPFSTTIRAPSYIPVNRQSDCIEPMRYSPRFAQTRVCVVNMDCLSATHQLQRMNAGLKCACLNMANQFSCGGGWKVGKLAQEESLFLRTNLSQGLSRVKYPLGDYTSILTNDVSVFRDTYSRGYEFFPESGHFLVNIITAAAVDLNTKHNPNYTSFNDEILMKTRLKIESLFALCANENVSVLVLGALGCGAFKNPAFEVAHLFKSVIKQYAGYFKDIVFCMTDNPTSEKLTNFAKVLVNSSITAVPPKDVLDGSIPSKTYAVESFFRPSPTPPEVLRKKICMYGSRCNSQDGRHFAEYIHPLPCPYGHRCNDSTPFHQRVYAHPHFNNQLPPQPQQFQQPPQQFQQPPQQFQQPPQQFQQPPQQFQQPPQQFQQPPQQFQQPPQQFQQPPQQFQQPPQQFHQQPPQHFHQHCGNNQWTPQANGPQHRFCNDPFLCKIVLNKKDPNYAKHINDFKHVCRFGSMCTDKSPEHLRMFVHMEKKKCKYGSNCTKTRSPKHRFKYSHEGMTDFMVPCGFNQCRNFSVQSHQLHCYHGKERFAPTMDYLRKCDIKLV